MELQKVWSSNWYIIFVVSLTIFTDVFVYGVIVPVLPYALISRVGIDEADLQFWSSVMLAAYSLMLLVGSLTCGWLGDRIPSRRWPFVIGQVILGAATILLVFARTVPLILIARLLQGLSTGVVFTVGYTFLYEAVGKEKIGQAIGYTSIGQSMGFFAGPLVGGTLYDAIGYELTFLPALVLIGLEVIMRLLVVEPAQKESSPTSAEQDPLLPKPNTSSRRASIGETHNASQPAGQIAPRPSADKHKPAIFILFKDIRFVVAMFAFLVVNSFAAAIESTLPVFAYSQLGYSSTESGLLFLCIALPIFLSPGVGWLSDRFGSKWPASIGFCLAGVSTFCLQLAAGHEQHRLAIMIVCLVGFGIAIALIWSPIVAEVTRTIDALEERQPGLFGDKGAITLAFGLENTAFGAGSLIGPIYAGVTQAKLGWPAMCITLGSVSLFTMIWVVIFTGGNVFNMAQRRKGSQSNPDTTRTNA